MDNRSSHRDESLQPQLNPVAPLDISHFSRKSGYQGGQAVYAPCIQTAPDTSNWSNHFYGPVPGWRRFNPSNEAAHTFATQRNNHLRPTNQPEPALSFQQPYLHPRGFHPRGFHRGIPLQTPKPTSHFDGHPILPPVFNHQRFIDQTIVKPAEAVPRPFALEYFYFKRVMKRKPSEDESNSEDPKRPRKDPCYELIALANEFPFVQHKTIRTWLSRHQTLLDAYEALYHLEQPGPNDDRNPLTRLRRVRPKNETSIPLDIQREIERIRKIVADNAKNLVECQCCFVDVAPKVAIPCNGDETHLFCRRCIKKYAETQVGQMNYDIKCIDVSGCHAGFEKALLQQVVGEKFLKRLEFLQQMDEISKSGIKGLEGCPFCEFKAVCLPLVQNEEAPEFSCQNPDCGKVSCRLCQCESHAPNSCEQAKKERGVPERREVEEAMTKALLRTCPKCGVSIIKESGCNKIQCRCGTLICDVCKANITKAGYKHFSREGCPPSEADQGQSRLVDEVQRAGNTAVDKIVAGNGSILREQLHIEASQPLAKEPETPAIIHFNYAPRPVNLHFPHPLLRADPAPFEPRNFPQYFPQYFPPNNPANRFL